MYLRKSYFYKSDNFKKVIFQQLIDFYNNLNMSIEKFPLSSIRSYYSILIKSLYFKTSKIVLDLRQPAAVPVLCQPNFVDPKTT